MARPCYVYLKLKMLGPKGVITITGNRKKAEECFQKGSKIADAQMVVVELQEYQKNADPSDLLRAKKPTTEHDPTLKFKPADETKLVDFVPGDSSKQFSISTTMDSK